MLIFDSIATDSSEHQATNSKTVKELETHNLPTVTLSIEQRNKTRLRVELDDGRDAGISLPRDQTMLPGSILLAANGEAIQVVAACERVAVTFTTDNLLFKRACYHLGNRHVQLQISEDWLAYQPDHVLDEMLTGLGLTVVYKEQPFEPENGAYSSAQHSHHDHDHSHDHKQREHGHHH